MKKAVDPRVIKTRRYLEEALLVLIEEKGFDEITVRNLTEHAKINRSTFYADYHDKYDLLNQTIDQILLALVTNVAPKSVQELTTGNSPNPAIVRLFEFIYEHVYFFQVMMGENGVPGFQHKMASLIRKIMNERLDQFHPNPEKMSVPKEIFIHYTSSAHIGLISYWLENDLKYTPQYMAKQLSDLTVNGPFGAAGFK